MLNACDVAIVSLVKGMEGVSVPSRIYNIFAAGKPIIALTEAGSELGRLIAEEDTGWLVPQTDVGALVQTIRAIEREHSLDTISSRARAAAETKYLFSQSMDKYYSLIERLLNE